MTNNDYDFEVRKLSQEFFTNYPDPPYGEIERKEQRGYACLLVETHYDYLICIPYRSHITHNNAYMFSDSQLPRPIKGRGLLKAPYPLCFAKFAARPAGPSVTV